MTRQHAVTNHEKAAAFDRIAREYLKINANKQTPEELKKATDACLWAVGREVLQLYPTEMRGHNVAPAADAAHHEEKER